ncbi:tetratricopeptide repeat protein [Dolichospermum sp. LEGE 00240]|jgi:glycosyltransferase involved in cell wall biosynthesis|nr:tetratricopeptide repeat protein [Dolichospermum sp. LEGE 00240]MDM3851280.1 tetratricopeptide repeat protein [Aphanizomenon gracile PMC627.10]MDM3855261.1 tetratricopeptide repeat protein [Aphanizomenon gracile PMC649.10]MDM3862291.1 tetratricopeptide repeat protein [Aphanizomenon gracile PMC644.10]
MKVSLCMIVKNEETTLPKCLGSVNNFVDEIVVLDTGSTDKTPQVAQQFGAKVHHFPWDNNFSSARNEALKYVTGDWILVLDADETLTDEIIPLLKSVISKEEYLVINLVRQEVGSTQSPYSLVSRLFRHHPNIYFDRPYHALIDDSVTAILTQEPHWQIGYLPGVAILHTGYQKAVINEQNKYAKAAAAMEEFFSSHPNDAYVCSKLGALYMQMGKINGGMELLNRGLNQLIGNQVNEEEKPLNKLKILRPQKVTVDFDEDINYDILYELHYHLGIGYTNLKDLPSAISHYQAAVKLPIYPLLKLGGYNNLGNLLKNIGDLPEAKIAYETAIKIDPNFVIGYYNLGMVCKAMGLFSEAIDAYNNAINLNPDYAEAYQNLGVVLLKIGDVENSLEAFEYAICLHELNNPEEAQRLHQGLKEMGLLNRE